MIHRISTIDAHTGGEPLRLIVDGFPRPAGRTMLEKRAWVKSRHDRIRRMLMQEPRGHVDMYGAVLTEPVAPGSDAGVLFMHNEGYSTMCGHGVIAVVTIGIERGLFLAHGDPPQVVLDSPAGPIRARAEVESIGESTRVRSVAFVNVPSFVLHGGLPIRVDGRELRVDVAFGGAFYAIVDSEASGVPVDARHLPELRRLGMAIKHAVQSSVTVTHPLEHDLTGIYGTIFTGPPHDDSADLRNVTIFAEAEVDRSPCGTGTCAVMAVIAAMGLLDESRVFTHESIIGSRFRGRIVGRTQVGDYDAIVPEIQGDAWITGEHTFLVDDDDPLREGFRL
jgi:proline racemase